MSLFTKLFGSGKADNAEASKENLSRSESAVSLQEKKEAPNGELVAVIMAAVMNMLSGDAASELKIKSIRRIGRNAPLWNAAGRDEYIASKL